MHFQEAKSILTTQNGLNIYRGCTKNCIFCDARSTKYKYDCEFTDVSVKSQANYLLEKGVRSKRSKGMIQTGIFSDPYMDCEKELKLMRECLKVIERYDFGIIIQTRSRLILRDLDILGEINRKTKCAVVVPISSMDESVMNRFEHPACGESIIAERTEIIDSLNAAGILWIMLIDTVIPGINDDDKTISGLLSFAKEKKAYAIEHRDFAMTMQSGAAEYFYERLRVDFPEFADKIIEEYSGAKEIRSKNSSELLRQLNDFCEENGIISDQEEIRRFKRVYENKTVGVQLSFFDE